MSDEPKHGIPWKAIAKNMALVGGGYLAGHIGTGIAIKGMSRTRAGKWFRSLSPKRRNVIRRRIGLSTGLLGSAVATALPYAREAHIDEEVEKMHKKSASSEGRLAQVYAAYALAMEQP